MSILNKNGMVQLDNENFSMAIINEDGNKKRIQRSLTKEKINSGKYKVWCGGFVAIISEGEYEGTTYNFEYCIRGLHRETTIEVDEHGYAYIVEDNIVFVNRI